jgi:hypothetical protein
MIGEFQDQSDDVQCVCDIFGPANFATVMQQAADDKNVRNIFQFNSASDPYALLIGGNLETDREQVAAALKAKGVPVWLQTLPGSGHGGAAISKPAIITLMSNFFDRHLRGMDVSISLAPESEVAVEPPQTK